MTTDERSMLIDSARRYVAKAYDFEQRNTILSLPSGADERQWQIEEDYASLHGVAELHEEEEEDDDDGEDAGEIEYAAGALLALKLSAVLDVIALGQLHFFAYRLLDVCHYVTQCSAAGVG